MYRTLTTVVALTVFVVASIVAAPVSRAVASEQGQLKPDDSSLYNLVTMDCLAVKFKLNDIHRRDKLARVTLGEGYNNVSTNFMGRLNSRIVENKLDGGDLIKVAAEFEKFLLKFRSDYTQYDDALLNLLKSDCQSQTQTYYVNLQNTKELRAVVYEDVAALDKLMQRYYGVFADFKATVLADEEKRAGDAN